MKEKTTIQIDSNIPKSVLIGFLLAFTTVFVIEHFSTFSYISNTGQSNIDNNGKFIISGTYYPAKTPVGALYQTTPFGTKINLPTNGMMCSELLDVDSDFKRYSNKVLLFAKSVFSDYKYLLIFWLAYTLIILFFKRYRLKVLFLILPILLISCDNKVVQEKSSITPVGSNYDTKNTQETQNSIQSKTEQIKHSFVVFKVRDKYFGKESVIVTGIFSTPEPLTTDEEYLILDDTQTKSNAYLFDKNILERFIMHFDTYAEASREREMILRINSNDKPMQNDKFKEEYDLLMIDSVSANQP